MVVGLHIGDRSVHSPLGAVYMQLVQLVPSWQPGARLVLIAREGNPAIIPGTQRQAYKKKQMLGQPLWLKRTLPGIVKKEGITHYVTYDPQELALPGVKTYFVADCMPATALKYLGNARATWATKEAVFDALRKKAPVLMANAVLLDTVIAPGFLTEQCSSTNHALSIEAGFSPAHIKDKYTGGTEYFICTDYNLDPVGLTLLLKAFSQFKKWQQSSWKLVVCADNIDQNEAISRLLATYRYRQDVVLAGSDKQIARPLLTAAAYALIRVTKEQTMPMLEALACAVPVIAAGTGETGVFANLILSVDNSPEALAVAMQDLYKDETFRKKMARTMPQEIIDTTNAALTAIRNSLLS